MNLMREETLLSLSHMGHLFVHDRLSVQSVLHLARVTLIGCI